MPITKQGLTQMEEELKQLKSVARPEVIRAIAQAREHGDLSENAEYWKTRSPVRRSSMWRPCPARP
jgi:transcription elongation factor GreA